MLAERAAWVGMRWPMLPAEPQRQGEWDADAWEPPGP